MKRTSITIIGMGPRGLSVFERLAALALHRQLLLDLILIEPGECGPGVHAMRQPQHLLINTLASQVTMFPAPGAVRHAPVCATPSLTEWARQAGYRRVDSHYYRLGGSGGHDIADTDYLPRGLLGEYLAWVYQQVAAALPAGVTVAHHRQRAVDLSLRPDGSCVIELESGYIVASDYVFLTTGHGSNLPSDLDAWLAKFAQDHARYNSRLLFMRQVYPVGQLSRIGAGARVAIQGLGLSAHDVIAELTVGRGGAFVDGADGGLRYVRSGSEPRLTLCSRNCLPFAARGVNQKGLDGRHQARHFTVDAVAALRRQALIARGSSQLDFDRDLLPLLAREIGAAWRAAAALDAVASSHSPDAAALDIAASSRSPDDDALLAALLFPLQDRQFATLADFRRYFRDWLQADLAEARRGNLASPAKAATDVLRDVRATLQAAIEHGGLTPASHRKFLNVYHPAINRAAFGPPLRRNAELLALLDAGVIELHAGPGSRIDIDETDSTYLLTTKFSHGTAQQPIDVVIMARLDPFVPESDTSLLIRNLLKRGLIRPYYNGMFHPGGIDLNRAGQPLDARGAPLANVWALGYLTEGAHYYTHALPRPRLRSRQVWDAEQCVMALAAKIDPHQRKQPVASASKHDTLQSN
ncbi:putative NAD(P)/FAD-binding protein YdhS [Duganella sp. 1224]|uniref:FAD/NAD(P)-binding protein n=1 Tax=Duganella sp. 1224 TaxID=2587052 RepID=UPI0015CCAFD3|nr:FAD/NAD(P)-binding domain-containing protein [Duganella sp. 1224]NYE63549.1 putative NAD(P)/FAD-binding protein YdhS [Duganella sp. 1224]